MGGWRDRWLVALHFALIAKLHFKELITHQGLCVLLLQHPPSNNCPRHRAARHKNGALERVKRVKSNKKPSKKVDLKK